MERRQHHIFAEESHRQRRKAFVSLRWRIRCDPNGRGLFTSHQMLLGGNYPSEEPLSPDHLSTWADIYFLSHRWARRGYFYNAEVITSVRAAMDDATTYAHEKAWNALTPEEQEIASPLPQFEPCGRNLYRMIHIPSARLPNHGNRTVHALRAQALQDWRQQFQGQAVGAWREPDYAYGIGLRMITRETNLTVDSLADAVESFLSEDERLGVHETVPPTDTAFAEKIQQALDYEIAAQEWMDRRDADGADEPHPKPVV